MKRLLLLAALSLLCRDSSFAGGHRGCCADCGCDTGLRKVCRFVCEEVEIKSPAWDCECEDIVIPGKSTFCIKDDCAECRDGVNHLGSFLNRTKAWGPPRDCCVKTVKVLVRTEKTIKKKVWKPVVETVCDRCACNGIAGERAAVAAPGLDSEPGDPAVAPQSNPSAPMPPVPAAAPQTRANRGFDSLFPAFTGPRSPSARR
jgi:hypothetical protein